MPEGSYQRRVERLTVEPGMIGYIDQPGTSSSDSTTSSTAEASLKVSYGVGPLLLFSAHYLDVVTTPGAYYGNAALQAARRVPLGLLRAHVELGWASASFNRVHHDVDSGALSVVIGGAEVRAEITDAAYVALHTEGSALLTQALRHSTREPDLYNVGVVLGVEASP